jgi:dTDP-4-amino-4,6-dideoxygalactose transaminase
LVKFLNENDIPCGIYYPVPLHLQKAYTYEGYNEDDFKVTNQLVKEVIALPMHSELTTDQIEFIVSKIKEFLSR